MSEHSLNIRNYRSGDFNGYFRLHAEAEKLDPSGRDISSRALAEWLGRPNYSPAKNVFVLEKGGKIIGCMSLAPELGIGRVILHCLVHPRYRRHGGATRLFSFAMERAEELGAHVVHMGIPGANVAAKGFVSSLGFKSVRRFLELKLEFQNIQLLDVKHSQYDMRELRPGEEDKLTEIQNRSFSGAWGFQPNTTEEIRYRLHMHGTSPGDVIMAYEGNRPVAYCWTKVSTKGNPAGGENKGQIHMLGVDPRYQEKGIGKDILLKALAHLKNKGVEVVQLTVDSKNRSARALYESAGFEVYSMTEWYEKPVG